MFQEMLARNVNTFNLTHPAKIAISNNVNINNNIFFTGDGYFRADGHITGTGTLNFGSGISGQINGNVTNHINNNGHLLVNGNVNTVTNNGTMLVTGGAGGVGNGGHITIGGTVGTISNTGNALLNNAAGALVTLNSGHMRLINANPSTTVNNNTITGQLLVESGTGVRINSNAGAVQSNVDNTSVGTNLATGTLRIYGDNAIITTNHGHIIIEGDGTRIGNNTSTGRVSITGDDTLITINAGHVTIIGDEGRITTNSGYVRIEGDDASVATNQSGGHVSIIGDDASINNNHNGGFVFIEGHDAIIGTNSGHLTVKGDHTHITLNTSTGIADFEGNHVTAITNNGNMRIVGYNANVGVNNLILHIRGDAATVGTNNWHAYINGNDATIHTNTGTGRALIRGDGATVPRNFVGGQVTIEGSNGTVHENAGDVLFRRGGNNTVIQNLITGRVRFDGGVPYHVTNGSVTNNRGFVDIASGSVVNTLGTNHPTGRILVRNGGTINDPTAINHGLIEVYAGGVITIEENTRTGRIISQGMSTMETNRGYLQVGIWSGDAITPPQGSAGGASVNTNHGGIIRNFSAYLWVNYNISGPFENEVIIHPDGCECGIHADPVIQSDGGRIENYGTLWTWDTIENSRGYDDDGNLMQAIAEVRHHIRRPYVGNINAQNQNAPQSFRFYVNGGQHPGPSPRVVPGSFLASPGGERRLVFSPSDLGSPLGTPHSYIVVNASPALEVPGAVYDVQFNEFVRRPSMDIAGSSGNSGRQLVFEIHAPFQLQVGANQGQRFDLNFRAMNPEFLGGLFRGIPHDLSVTNVLTSFAATCSIATIDHAATQVSTYRAELGAKHNNLEHIMANLAVASQNLTEANSRIRDTDMALEMMVLHKKDVLQNAAMMILAQANQMPEGVLQLLQ